MNAGHTAQSPAVRSATGMAEMGGPVVPAAVAGVAPYPGHRARRRRRRMRAAVGVAAGALLVAAGAVAAVGYGDTGHQPAGRSRLPAATAQVTRTTLTRTETVDGTLGYGSATTVTARAGTAGTLTWLPAAGAVIGRGQPVYKVDAQPVVLLYGTAPLYRTLSTGVKGADVKLLEQNLYALGYRGFNVDSEYSGATADAVRKWQKDLGLTKTGTVGVDQVVVVSGPVRVTDRKLALGDPASGAVLTYTGTTRIVTVHLDVAKQHLVRTGIAATVQLPDGTKVAGRVAAVGTVATTEPSPGSGSPTTTIDVTVSLDDQRALGSLDAAPVGVVLQAEQRRDVLTVPVGALVALAEGGYGVQVVEGSTTRYVAVQTGMFADGRVEVTGGGLAEGMTVGVPA